MKDFTSYFAIKSVDAAKRQITGLILSEAPDRQGEITDYASMLPLLSQWSSSFKDATDGSSVGNLREMHQRSAVGKFVSITPNDAAKEVLATAEVIDDDAWKKCETGVYTGFSVSGPYARKWRDGAHTRVTIEPREFSLVDYPANPEALFSYKSADGQVEDRKFATLAKKGMYAVGNLANLLGTISFMQQDSQMEADMEGDGSDMPAKLKAWLATGVELLTGMAGEEGAELVMAAKRGAKHSAETMGHVNAIADAHKTMGEHIDALKSGDCDTAEKSARAASGVAQPPVAPAPPPAAAAPEIAQKLATVSTERDTLQTQIAAKDATIAEKTAELSAAETALKEANAELKKLLDQPVARKSVGTLATVSKEEDEGLAKKDATPIPGVKGDPATLRACIRAGTVS